ncbi:MAG TPA: galactokinase [Candidatus Obscuribacterales bacterium]
MKSGCHQEESTSQHLRVIVDIFAARHGTPPKMVARAPGRVNLIGEHTDYNGGFVLPVAIDREMMIAFSPSAVARVEVYSAEYDESDSFDLSAIEKNPERPWSDYLRGTLATLKNQGHAVSGFTGVLSGNVPQGAGLSSSAAYEVAAVAMANALNGLSLEAKEMALLAQKAENDFVGVRCGIMDQFVSALGEQERALFIDCRSLDFKSVPLELTRKQSCLVVTNSGVRRGLVDSEYNARREECQEGTLRLSALLHRQLESLRDISEEEIERYESELPEVVARRCRHVVRENARVERAVAALVEADLERFGRLMNDSHQSLRDDFQVSCPEIDLLVDLTQKHRGVFGARITGAGFGGCTVALMQDGAVEEFRQAVIPRYEEQTRRQAGVYVFRAVKGAEVLSLE